MLDPALLRSDLEAVIAGLARRGFRFDRETFTRLEGERRHVIQEAEVLKAERNRVSDEVGRRKRAKEDATDLIAAQREVGERLKALEAAEKEAEAAFRGFLAMVPNLPHESVPEGQDERANLQVKAWAPRRPWPGPWTTWSWAPGWGCWTWTGRPSSAAPGSPCSRAWAPSWSGPW